MFSSQRDLSFSAHLNVMSDVNSLVEVFMMKSESSVEVSAREDASCLLFPCPALGRCSGLK